VAPFTQHVGVREIERWKCPKAAMTAEHRDVFLAMNRERAGHFLYPSPRDYPVRLLRQIEVARGEVDEIRAKLAKRNRKGPRRG